MSEAFSARRLVFRSHWRTRCCLQSSVTESVAETFEEVCRVVDRNFPCWPHTLPSLPTCPISWPSKALTKTKRHACLGFCVSVMFETFRFVVQIRIQSSASVKVSVHRSGLGQTRQREDVATCRLDTERERGGGSASTVLRHFTDKEKLCALTTHEHTTQ